MQGGVSMNCYEKFKKKMQYNGGSLRQEKINSSKRMLQEVFADDPSIVNGVFLWTLGADNYDNVPQLIIRMYNRKSSAAIGVTIKFQTLIDTPINIGDIVYCSQSQEYWICTQSFNIDTIHYEGTFTLCNWILKWQNQYGVILEYPCYDINATQYNSGERFDKQITIGSSQHIITLPCDENTVLLSTPQRFILDKNKYNPTTFIVTQNDNTSYNYGTHGLVKITVYEHPFDKEKDRADLGICNYIDPEYPVDSDSDTIIAKIIYDSLILKSGGDSQTFVGKFYQGKNEIDNMLCSWKIVCDFADKLIITENGNRITISFDDDDYIDEDIKLIFSNDDESIQDTILIHIDSLY